MKKREKRRSAIGLHLGINGPDPLQVKVEKLVRLQDQNEDAVDRDRLLGRGVGLNGRILHHLQHRPLRHQAKEMARARMLGIHTSTIIIIRMGTTIKEEEKGIVFLEDTIETVIITDRYHLVNGLNGLSIL